MKTEILPASITTLDLVDEGLVTNDQLDSVVDCALRLGRSVRFDNQPPDSTLESCTDELEYQVLDGTAIRRELPLISDLYNIVLPKLLASRRIAEVKPSKFERSGITVNILEGVGARYELHIDTNPLTGLLFATTNSGHGGELRLHLGENDYYDVIPKRGLFLVYDARSMPHEVLPLTANSVRASLPMNFFPLDFPEIRPDRLDDYIFGAPTAQ